MGSGRLTFHEHGLDHVRCDSCHAEIPLNDSAAIKQHAQAAHATLDFSVFLNLPPDRDVVSEPTGRPFVVSDRDPRKVVCVLCDTVFWLRNNERVIEQHAANWHGITGPASQLIYSG